MKPVPLSSSPLTSSRPPFDQSFAVGPIPDDEDIASELVDMGRRIADGELRDAVTEVYVDEANADDETEEALKDIARCEATAASDLTEEIGPERNAIHREVSPAD